MAFTQGHAIVIGVGSHKFAPSLNVPISVRDAQAVVEVLTDTALCGYPEEQVHLVHDSEATREGILMTLDRLANRVGEKDTVFIFYCGHGDYGTDGEYYLISHDAQVEGSQVRANTGVSQRELLTHLRKLRAKRAIMIFNACHSAELVPNAFGPESVFGASPLPTLTAEALLSTGEGRILLTACRKNQVSYIGTGELSIFTQALVDGLSGKGIAPRGGVISIFDLYMAVYETVGQKVKETLGKVQEPELTIQRGTGAFAVALYRGAAQASMHLEEFPQNKSQGAIRSLEKHQVERAANLFWGRQVGNVQAGHAGQVSIAGGNLDIQSGGVRAGRDINAVNMAGGDLFIRESKPANLERQELRRQIHEFQMQITQVELENDVKELLEEDLRILLKEIGRLQPNKVVLHSRIQSIQVALQETVASGSEIPGLVKVFAQIQGTVRQLIG